MTEALIIAIIEAGLKYGPGIATSIAAAWETGTPTVEQIRALKIEKDPDDYFTSTASGGTGTTNG